MPQKSEEKSNEKPKPTKDIPHTPVPATQLSKPQFAQIDTKIQIKPKNKKGLKKQVNKKEVTGDK